MEDYVSSERIVAVISKKEFELLSKDFPKENVVVISVTDPEGVIPVDIELLKDFDDVLQISFWDLEESIGRIKIISDEEALIIRNFIEKNKNKKFIIHCMAGMSRSAGIARAVECICDFGNDEYLYATSESPVKSHPRYTPNLVVFDKIVNAV